VSGVIRRWSTSHRDGSDGFAMVEMMISLVLIAIVMTAAIVFFVNGLRSDSGQRQRQEAIYLADQQMQTVQAIPANDLVFGRTSSAQTAAASNAMGTALNLAAQSDLSSTASYDSDTSDATLIPLSQTQTVNSIPYTIWTFVYACHVSPGNGATCGPTAATGSTQELRITVATSWTSNANCTGGCHYATSTLVDPNNDQTFNTNISQPQISTTSTGPFYNDDAALDSRTSLPYQTCPSLTTASPNNGGAELVITGTGFKSGVRVWISSGGGSIPVAGITQPSPSEVDACVQAGDLPGQYTISVINPDGGHDQTTITESPIIRWVALSGSGASQALTLHGGGFVTGATFAGTGGITGAATLVPGAGAPGTSTSAAQMTQITSYVGPAAGTSPTITVTDPSPSNAVTPAFALPDMSSTTVPTSVAVNTTVAVGVTGTAFENSPTALALTGVLNNATAAPTTASVAYTSATTATVTIRATSVGTESFALLNSDGGVSNTITLNVDPLPTITPAPGSRVVGVPFNVTGTNFMTGMTASLPNGDSVVVNSLTVPGTISLTIGGTSYGLTTLTLRNPDGGSVSTPITVTAPPLVTGVTTAVSGQVTETLTGTGFQSAMTITDPGGTIGTITHTGSTSVTFMITDTPGTQTLTLTNPDGGTTTVNVPLDTPLSITAPTLTAFEGVPVTVAGSGFVSGLTTSTPGATVQWLSATSVRVTFNNPGSQSLVLTNPDGGSDSATATVTGPTITNVTVGTAVHGAGKTAPITVTGTGLTTTSVYTAVWTKGGTNTPETVTTYTGRTTTTANFTIPTPSTSGTYSLTVTVTNPDTSTDSFTKSSVSVS
jgi:prepilin-type N-terminal cleavage/methylation domain-containing protein